jgi:hypothetical protein
MATNRILILAEHKRTMGIRYGKFGKEYEVKQGTN